MENSLASRTGNHEATSRIYLTISGVQNKHHVLGWREVRKLNFDGSKVSFS